MKRLDRIPLDVDILVRREVLVLDAVELHGRTSSAVLRAVACASPMEQRMAALDLVEEIFESNPLELRTAAAVVAVEHVGGSVRIVEVYELAVLRALFAVLEELGTVYCGRCRADGREVTLNPDDVACYRCGAQLAPSEAA